MKYLTNSIKKIWANWDLCLAIFITVSLFLFCFGFEFLDVNDIDIVTAGGDFTNCYLGSVFYRMDAWRWPPFTMQNLGYPFGMSAYGADIGPLLSFVFKVMHTFFGASPEWQFVGIWTLICYILQAYASVLIFRHATTNRFLVVLGALFFVCTPLMLARVLVHINLQPHFLILFSMLLWLNNKLGKKEWVYIGILYSLAFLTCPYFLPMQTGFFGLLWYQKLFVEKQLKFSHFMAALGCLAVMGLFWAYMLGLFTMNHKLDAGGWGRFGLNLGGFFVPGWLKTAIPVAPAGDKVVNYDIDFYFGFGVFALIFLTLPAFKNLFKKETLHKYWPVMTLMLGLFLFALSPRIRYNKIILFEYHPNGYLAWLGNTFRYSARFFWPIWYMIVFFVIKAFYGLWKKKAIWIIVPVFVAQLLDVSTLLMDKRLFIGHHHIIAESRQISWTLDRWEQLAQKYSTFFYFSHKGYEDLWRLAIKYHQNVSFGFLNRPNPKLLELVFDIRSQLLSGYLDSTYKDYLIVLDEATLEKLLMHTYINPAVKNLFSHLEKLDTYYILEYIPELGNKPNFFVQPVTISVQYPDKQPNDLIQVNPYRLYRMKPDGLAEYATIISFNEDTLMIDWDENELEIFKKEDDGIYHFDRRESTCILPKV